MRQIFITPALVCSTLLLTGALDRQSLFSDSSAGPLFVPRSAESAGASLLDQVSAALAPERVQWLEMKVRQKMFGDEAYESAGRCLLGAGGRMRLEMNVSASGKTCQVLMVSDGKKIRHSLAIAGQEPMTKESSLPPLDPSVDARALAKEREDFVAEHGFAGLRPLLATIRARLQNPQRQEGLWKDQRVIRLSGDWPADEALLKTLPAGLRARRCNLYLDAATLWPCRVEWIGSPRPQDRRVILLQMEFLDPVLNRALSEQECAREFQFGPG